ncbi:hypothetical protein M436DRAFT_84575 [Aureobasidium namibiae CBS 147.97]|uniref:Uncharacterized protein n=1 Tax=Aureobasidium namibiae CBS 147.97 TaxID=1043004 RepID=A0A074WKY6_9PEZI
MSAIDESMTDSMTEASDLAVSKTVQQLGNDLITDLSERIVGTQTLLDMHKTIRTNYEKDLRRFHRTASNSLKKGMTAVQASLAHVDKSLEIQRKIVEETEEIAKFAREQFELIEQRQAAIRNMVENA